MNVQVILSTYTGFKLQSQRPSALKASLEYLFTEMAKSFPVGYIYQLPSITREDHAADPVISGS